jgi:hypothetical protein
MSGNNNLKNCRECQYSREKKCNLVGVWVGECRRLPPLLLLVPGGQGAASVSWPIVQEGPEFFCFEFSPRPGVLVAAAVPEKENHKWPALDRLEAAINNLRDQVNEYFKSH